MLAVLLAMLLLDILRQAMAGRYSALSQILATDPGPRGLAVLIYLLALNAVVQPVIHVGSSHGFRTAIFVLTALSALFFLLHRAVHLLKGEKPGLHTILDAAHHVVGAVGTWAAWEWMDATQAPLPTHQGASPKSMSLPARGFSPLVAPNKGTPFMLGPLSVHTLPPGGHFFDMGQLSLHALVTLACHEMA